MTTSYLPPRRRLIGVGALALAVIRHTWRRGRRVRRPRRLDRWAQAFALLSGARSARRLALAQSGELHVARLETERARAAELRSRVEHRRRTREEQEKAERAAYYRGAADAEGFKRS